MSPNSEHTASVERRHKFFALSPEVLSRVVVLVFALAALKLILLVGLRKHMQQIHWRVSTEEVNTLGVLSFYVLALVLVCCLVQFGRQCQTAGVRVVRAANVTVLAIGGLVIFLSFQEGGKNYAYPVMTGVLKWWHLWSYLSMNLFFRAPYLAVWILVYVASYYLLARTGRERHALTLTAIFSGLYWVLCLREFMMRCGDLWVVFLFGLLSLLMLQFPKRPFRAVWLLLPAGWTLLMWYLFSLGESDLTQLQPYFVMLIGGLTVLFGAATLTARWNGFLHPWLNLMPFLLVGTLLLSNAYYPLATNYNNLLGFAAKFPPYFLGELLVGAIVGVVAWLWLWLRPGGNLKWLDVVSVVLIFGAILDLRLTQIMGVRLGWDVIAFANDPRMMVRMAAPYLPLLGLTMLVVGVAYVFAVRRLTGWLGSSGSLREKCGQQSAGWYLAGCFGAFAVLGTAITKPDIAQGQSVFRLVQTSPLWRRAVNPTLSREEFLNAAQALGMPDWHRERTALQEQPRRDLNVLLVFQESTFNQHLSLFSGDKETQPHLRRYKDRMEVFPNFFSSFAGSIHARFATFTGLYPVRDFNHFTMDRVPVQSIFEVLTQNGYECSLFYSSFFDYTGFRSFLRDRNLAQMYDADTMPGAAGSERVQWGLKEEATTRAIRQQLRKHATDGKRFFLTYIPAAPHYPYDKIPREFCNFPTERYGDFTSFYLNALLYMDWNIASLLDELKETGLLDKTLVIITSDHGEMLGENNGPMGHGWCITPRLVNVPLIVMDPDQKDFRINERVGSQVDLLPTILDALGVPMPRGELYQGASLIALPPESERTIYLSSYEDFAVVVGREVILGSRSAQDADSFRVFQMTNLDAITTFTETNKAVRPFSIRQFDDFQESFLRDYASYLEVMPAHRPVVQMTPK